MRSIVLVCVVIVMAASRGLAVERVEPFPLFGTAHLYYEEGRITQPVLFISGDGGWNLGVVDMARTLEHMGALVIGVNIIEYLRALEAQPGHCSYPAADFEALSQYVQKKLDLPTYTPPIVIGYSSGATLAYALIAQAPSATFKGAISMGFCPDLPLTKGLCEGSGLHSTPGPNGKGVYFLPRADLQVPWVAFQGDIDQVCSADSVDAFVKQVGSGKVVMLPKVGHGFSVPKNWEPQFKQAFAGFANPQAAPPESAAVAESLAGLPLVEVPAESTSTRDVFAVVISGDGGWASIDRDLGQALSHAGIPVVGLNSLQYFWHPRTPEQAAADLDRVIGRYAEVWHKSRVMIAGYSMGADVLPFMASRLPSSTLDKIDMFAFLGLSPTASLEFHLSDWMGAKHPRTGKPVLPEIAKLKGRNLVYVYGTDERDNLAAAIDSTIVKHVAISGGHHFGGQYAEIADTLLSLLPKH